MLVPCMSALHIDHGSFGRTTTLCRRSTRSAVVKAWEPCCGTSQRAAGAIRPATVADAESLHKLFETQHLAWTRRAVELELMKEYALVLLFETPHPTCCVVGALLGWQIADELQVLELVVDAAYRHQGIGSALMNRLVMDGRGLTVVLEVSADNAAALALYHKHGFRTVGRRKGYYSNGTDALLMQRDPK